ncbi:MAG: 3'-5' exonuclease [Burkholderiales bacterium]
MSLLGWWLGRGSDLPKHLAGAVEAWRRLAEPDLDRPLADLRWVVVDTESSGLDPARDRLLSVGACAMRHRVLHLNETFEVCIRQAAPSAEENILVHGISGSAQLAGEDPPAALAAFLEFLRGDLPIAFHAAFDAALIARALRTHLGVRLRRRWFDAEEILAALFPQDAGDKRSLDQWLAHFGISGYSRHDALADAFATAELLMVALEQASARGISTARELERLCSAHKELARLRRAPARP